jgi:hypothetical protein
MTNSFFFFEESPDYGSVLGDSYKSVNTSYDRREELERENDKTRLKNAKMPLEMIKALAEFAPTFKKFADEIAWDKYNEDALKEIPFKEGTLEYEEFTKLQEFLDKSEKLNSEMLGDAYKSENIPKINALKADGISQRSLRNIQFNADKVTWTGDLANYANLNNKSLKFKDLSEADQFVNAWWAQKQKNLIAAGFNKRYIDFFGKKEFESIKKTFLTNVSQKILTDNLAEDDVKDRQYIANAYLGDNFNEDIYKWADLNKGRFNNNIAEALRHKINMMTELNRANKLPYSVTENFLYSITKAKGDIPKMIIEKLGGSLEADIQINKWLEALEKSKTDSLDAINTRDSNYKSTYYNEMREALYKDGNVPTKEELVDYIYKNKETRFDWSTGGLPEKVKDLLSAEAQKDAELIPLYEKKAKLGILTVADVMKLENSTLRAQYLQQAISVNNMGTSSEMLTMSKEAITTMADEIEKDSLGKKEKSSRWLSIKQQATLLYPSLYAANLKVAAPNPEKGLSIEAVAHAMTMKQLYEKASLGHFDNWGDFTTNTLKMQSAVEFLQMEEGTLQQIRDNTYNKIIPGYEDDIKRALDLAPGSKTVLPAFKQLGDRIGIPGALIQLNQKTIAEKLDGKEHIKSDVELAFEKLTEKQKELLTKYPTPAKLARAKFLAFLEDSGEGEGVITWNELSVLHEDVAKFIYEEETGNKYPVTPTLGKLEPRKGDWKELPGATRIGYVVWDGKEWVYSSLRGRNNQKWIGSIEDYKGHDGYYYPFEGNESDLTTTFFGHSKPINTAEEGGPRPGDWYKTTNKPPGLKHIGDLTGGETKPYVIWNGKEWVYSAVKGKFREEYQGPQPLSKIDEEEEFKESLRNKNILRQ